MKSQRRWHVGVVIPARDEEDLLPRCLRSVLAAKAHLANSATVDIVVVADSSTDGTLQIATEMLGSCGVAMSIDAGVVGVARAAGTRLMLERYAGALTRCWIANTDADCIVPPAWLRTQLDIADRGTEAIAGTVSVDNFSEHRQEVAARFRASYLIDPNGSHPHVHGANLGVRADAYIRAGGWSDFTTAEDHDLWKRLARIGARRQSTSSVTVETSGRRKGRAPNGFADALAAHNETAA